MKNIQTRYGKIRASEVKRIPIPKKPLFPLDNYLPRFIDKELDANSTSVKICYVSETQKKIPFYELAKEDINMIKFCQILTSPHKVTLPHYLNPQLAYLTGYLYGDGGFKDIRRSRIVSNRFEYKMILGDEFKEQIEYNVIPLFKKIFNVETPLRTERILKGEQLYYINPTCKLIYRFFARVFQFPEGPKHDLKIPRLIKKSSNEIRGWFLRGLFDADGGVQTIESRKKPKNACIRLRLADENFVNELQKEVQNVFGLHLTGPYSDEGRDWYIQGDKPTAVLANQRKLFWHPIKKWRLRVLAEKIKDGNGEI